MSFQDTTAMSARTDKLLASLFIAAIAALLLAVLASRFNLSGWINETTVGIGLLAPAITYLIDFLNERRRKNDRTAELHKDFTNMMQVRTDAWFETADIAGKISRSHEQYVALWTIASFYARLGFLYDANLLNQRLAVEMFGQTFVGWYRYRFEKLGSRHSSEMKRIESFYQACRERTPPQVFAEWVAAAEERLPEAGEAL